MKVIAIVGLAARVCCTAVHLDALGRLARTV
jgi:hypothetical protein